MNVSFHPAVQLSFTRPRHNYIGIGSPFYSICLHFAYQAKVTRPISYATHLLRNNDNIFATKRWNTCSVRIIALMTHAWGHSWRRSPHFRYTNLPNLSRRIRTRVKKNPSRQIRFPWTNTCITVFIECTENKTRRRFRYRDFSCREVEPLLVQLFCSYRYPWLAKTYYRVQNCRNLNKI